MKCRYNYCKNGNTVEKEDAIKIGSAYYCKECYQEKEDKVKISNIIHEILPCEVKQNVNKCICDWIHKKSFNVNYVMYTLDYIKKNKCSLKSVYGVIYYLNNEKVLSEYENKNMMEKYRKMSQSTFECDDQEVKFTYKSDTGKGWCKVL